MTKVSNLPLILNISLNIKFQFDTIADVANQFVVIFIRNAISRNDQVQGEIFLLQELKLNHLISSPLVYAR